MTRRTYVLVLSTPGDTEWPQLLAQLARAYPGDAGGLHPAGATVLYTAVASPAGVTASDAGAVTDQARSRTTPSSAAEDVRRHLFAACPKYRDAGDPGHDVVGMALSLLRDFASDAPGGQYPTVEEVEAAIHRHARRRDGQVTAVLGGTPRFARLRRGMSADDLVDAAAQAFAAILDAAGAAAPVVRLSDGRYYELTAEAALTPADLGALRDRAEDLEPRTLRTGYGAELTVYAPRREDGVIVVRAAGGDDVEVSPGEPRWAGFLTNFPAIDPRWYAPFVRPEPPPEEE